MRPITNANVEQTASGCSASSISLLHDAYRFGVAFAEEIAFGPDSVYTSALSFCPQDASIYGAYKSSAEARVRVVEGVESQWSECLSTLSHSEAVNAIAFSPDSSLLASGSKDNTIRVWDVASGHCTGTLTGHTGEVRSVAFSPGGARLASGSWDTTVRVWNVAAPAQRRWKATQAWSRASHSLLMDPGWRRGDGT